MCSACSAPVRKDWLIIVPVRDEQGQIWDWAMKGLVPSATVEAALAIARKHYGPEADVRERKLSFTP